MPFRFTYSREFTKSMLRAQVELVESMLDFPELVAAAPAGSPYRRANETLKACFDALMTIHDSTPDNYSHLPSEVPHD